MAESACSSTRPTPLPAYTHQEEEVMSNKRWLFGLSLVAAVGFGGQASSAADGKMTAAEDAVASWAAAIAACVGVSAAFNLARKR